ncbi:tyrosine-type recombinase/integrase [Sinorhizobium meliloti]|uniref:tyrosine-type recombinase/integrase n=1 Tax=Rhizobium meliloti TaxID=382 RepID=UPI001E4F7767|nr:tyrosine-type recombinase/integrase [Sinorhizobium meliloti]UFX12978.1 tyrosine-type recombinase/integrase [Sinorhizobium meliloti]
MPKLKTLLKDAKTEWQRIVASSWYGKQTDKTLDVTSGTGLWYRRGTPPRPIRWVLVRDPSGRREPQAFMSTNVNLEPAQIIAYFVRRWQIEVTFAETRAHLGVETQRQWNDKAIMRTTPSLLALYSLVTLWACDLLGHGVLPYAAAWYKKTEFTFSDAIGAVRMILWEATMPLRHDVGTAIVAYIRHGRPASACRRVFLRTLAPHVGFASGCAITMIAKQALERAGIDGYAHHGAHLFRHSLATDLLRSGASFAEIAQLLRHRSIDSTRIYAKLHIEKLRELSLPGPGGVQ